MSTWARVADLAARLPDASAGRAGDEDPAYFVGRHPFARLRHDEHGRELLQTWTGDLDTPAVLAERRDVFPVVRAFTYRVTTWAYVDALDERELAELVLDSYLIRGPVGRRGLDVSRYLPGSGGSAETT